MYVRFYTSKELVVRYKSLYRFTMCKYFWFQVMVKSVHFFASPWGVKALTCIYRIVKLLKGTKAFSLCMYHIGEGNKWPEKFRFTSSSSLGKTLFCCLSCGETTSRTLSWVNARPLVCKTTFKWKKRLQVNDIQFFFLPIYFCVSFYIKCTFSGLWRQQRNIGVEDSGSTLKFFFPSLSQNFLFSH